MSNKDTFRPHVQAFANEWDCSKTLGPLASAGIIREFSDRVKNPKVTAHLKKCDNLIQILNVIDQSTNYLDVERSEKEIDNLLIGLARIKRVAALKQKV